MILCDLFADGRVLGTIEFRVVPREGEDLWLSGPRSGKFIVGKVQHVSYDKLEDPGRRRLFPWRRCSHQIVLQLHRTA